ncbi:MAG: hypothetical protein AB7Q00_00060 [Phycisphaerales bacterium]
MGEQGKDHADGSDTLEAWGEGRSAPLDDADRMTRTRPPRRLWPYITTYLVLQTFVAMVVSNIVLGNSFQSVDSILTAIRYGLSNAEGAVGAFAVAVLQLCFIVPVRKPGERDDARVSWWRVLAAGLGVGACAMGVGLALLHILQVFGVFPFTGDRERTWWFLGGMFVIGLPLGAYFKRRFRGGMPVTFSLIVAGMVCGLLVGAIAGAALGAWGLVTSNSPGDRVAATSIVASVIVGWIVAAPLVLAFMRRGPKSLLVEFRLARLAQRLFIGSAIEALAILPIDVMVRRRTSCYCSEGTFWSLILMGSAGLLALGPMVFLLPLGRRRQRLVDGCCPACGYDMTATPKAERCPECGVGWRAVREP